MAKSVTLADIAAKVGVSSVAVYKALADKPGVSDKLRERIKQLADEMGYVSGAAEKAEAASKTGNIGIVIPEQYYGYSLSFYGQLHERVVKALYRSEYFGMLEIMTPEDEKALNMPKLMQDGKVDGLILLGQMGKPYIDFMISQRQLPVIFLDTYIPLVTFDTVISDGYYGTYLLTNYLIRQGHRRIGFVGSVNANSSIADRYWGYRKALREGGIVYEDSWEIPDRDERGNLFEESLREWEGMDAFVCNCDFTADLLIRSLEAKGCRIPEDISVVGVDDFLPQGMNNDRITTYRVDMDHMAELCVKSLVKKINGKKYTEGIQIVTGKIIYKKTVAKRKRQETDQGKNNNVLKPFRIIR
jgi:DNA-binding LacI/PurR family transcriptional regulator